MAGLFLEQNKNILRINSFLTIELIFISQRKNSWEIAVVGLKPREVEVYGCGRCAIRRVEG
jgi:hypothetical protein